MDTTRNIVLALSELELQMILRAVRGYIDSLENSSTYYAWENELSEYFLGAIQQKKEAEQRSRQAQARKRHSYDDDDYMYGYKRRDQVSQEKFDDGTWIDEVPDWMPPNEWLDGAG